MVGLGEALAVGEVRGGGSGRGVLGVDAGEAGRGIGEFDLVTCVADFDESAMACGCGGEQPGCFGGVPAEHVTDARDVGGWCELLLESSSPVAGPAWTDSGQRREERPLKHRVRGETRVVPRPPALTALLRVHLESFGNGPDVLLVRGVRGGEMSKTTYCRVWRKARVAALSADEVRSPFARRPYNLRHAAVSTWLNAGVPPTQVAAWALHSVAVLLQISAKCLSGQEDAARRRIDAALRGD